MSDQQQAEGWWRASDGKWYPPEQHPQHQPPQPPGYPPPYPPQPVRTMPPPQWTTDGDIAPLYEPPPKSNAGVVALVTAIGSWVFCPIILAIVSLVFAARAAREMREVGENPSTGIVLASRIIAILNLAMAPLVTAMMLAIAVPTFLGAQERAQDRSAQSELRNAVTAAKVYYTDDPEGVVTPEILAMIEPSITYESSDGEIGEDIVDVVSAPSIVGLGTQSESGTCFYIAGGGTDPSVQYAEDDDCGPIEDQDYSSSWSG